MATLKPFRALRPRPDLAKDVCSLPYDVMNTEEARKMAEGNPNCFLRVTRAEIEFDDSVDSHSDEVYRRGGEKLRELIAEGVLVREDKPCYYLYRLVMGDHSQLGIVAAASCREYDEGIVKKHELTRPDKEDDRTRHINLLGCQTGSVFLTYRAKSSIDSLLAKETQREADIDFVAEDDIRHTLWIVKDDDVVSRIESEFAEVPALYVADGHHRSAAASRVARERGGSGSESWNYFLTVTFPHDQMQILGYNRAVRDLNGHSPDEIVSRLEKIADLSDAPADRQPRCKNEVTMYLDGKWRLLKWKNDVSSTGDPVGDLDVSILQKRVLEPVLAIGDPRTDTRISFVGGIRGTKELERLVDGGDYAVAFAMFPTSVEDLMEIADADGLMPPKSTWFEPKLRDAMACHMIDD